MCKHLSVWLLVFVLGLPALGLAADLKVVACTKDNHAVETALTIDDGASGAIIKEIAQAFREAARKLTAEDFLTMTGFLAFFGELSDAAKEAINTIERPTITGRCSAS